MTTCDALLGMLYEIQGASDPGHPADDLVERMEMIHDLACQAMRDSGYDPDPQEDTI